MKHFGCLFSKAKALWLKSCSVKTDNFSWEHQLFSLSMFSLSHSISQSSDSSSGCFVSSEVRGSGREGKRSSIVSLHGSPRAWVYGLGQNWSSQIQFLLLAQSLLVSFLSKRLHLAVLVQKLPIFNMWRAMF
jgi:hypothetical protein